MNRRSILQKVLGAIAICFIPKKAKADIFTEVKKLESNVITVRLLPPKGMVFYQSHYAEKSKPYCLLNNSNQIGV